ncbi:hypothetical protein SKAU_G00402070 [Synaphobranchus kaupii]|uniref:Uncharacterized protein n=1 Tax=Synaphobranchus kaupii TaxID=118154 RepID=A0A9Q1E9A9_SYNKA|nr:hypothetical protein SKAU_G00402070 [Synaphobranchus kaupii]
MPPQTGDEVLLVMLLGEKSHFSSVNYGEAVDLLACRLAPGISELNTERQMAVWCRGCLPARRRASIADSPAKRGLGPQGFQTAGEARGQSFGIPIKAFLSTERRAPRQTGVHRDHSRQARRAFQRKGNLRGTARLEFCFVRSKRPLIDLHTD